ncbi:MAG: S-layer homology domain-containing protein [Oscillospiraceae bacterium]|nr:S-layer homology domain-containing protein [Oscillospiraceae bacterium]
MKETKRKLRKSIIISVSCVVLLCLLDYSSVLSYAEELFAVGVEAMVDSKNMEEMPISNAIGLSEGDFNAQNVDAEDEHPSYSEDSAFIGMVIEYNADELYYIPEFADVDYGMETYLTAHVYYSGGLYYVPDPFSVTWRSNDEKVFWVDDGGILYPTGIGTANLTAEYTNPTTEEYFTITQAITIHEGSIVELVSDEDNITTFLGIDQYTPVYAQSSNGFYYDITYSEELNTAFTDPNVANYCEGVLEPKASGKTTLIATMFGFSTEIEVSVVNPEKLAIAASEDSLIVYMDMLEYVSIVASSSGCSVDVTEYTSWDVLNPSVVEVVDGYVYGMNFGSTTITASYGGESLSIPVEVVPYPLGVKVGGKVRSYNPNDDTRLQLMLGDELIQEIYIPEEDGSGQINQEFAFEGIQPGTYTLVVSKKGHTTFTARNIVVGENDVDLTQDPREDVRLISLKYGDIKGDGVLDDAGTSNDIKNGSVDASIISQQPSESEPTSNPEGAETIVDKELPRAGKWINPYVDVNDADWFYNAVRFVSENNLMNGTAADRFSPNIAMTRAMIVTILYRLEGQPAVTGSIPFPDVQQGQWYTDAVIWATGNDVVYGYTDGTFGWAEVVTREELVTILYRYSIKKEFNISASADLSIFTDMKDIGDWALDAMKWAVAVGVIQGRTQTTIVPRDSATRAEVAMIFKRYLDYRTIP